MRRIRCVEFAPLDRLVVEEVAPIEPGPGQVTVSVRAAGVNYVDGLIVEGRYQIKPPLPFTPGMEIAGVVRAVGADVDTVTVGDAVFGMCGFGGFASEVCLPAISLVAVPEALSFGQAATLIQSYATALYALARRASVEPGEWVLVLGAGGGVGLAAIDVACSLGARVIAAASTEEKLDAARSAGAEAAIAYEDEDVKVLARELSGGGVDVVVDPVGGRHAEPALRSLRVGGRYLVIGFAAGDIPRLPANQILLNNRSVLGVDWGAWSFQQPQAFRSLLDELVGLVSTGALRPTEPTAHPLEDAALVLDALEHRRLTGKAVLTP